MNKGDNYHEQVNRRVLTKYELASQPSN